MAAAIYADPQVWKDDLIGALTDPETRLMLEIYNQLKAIAP